MPEPKRMSPTMSSGVGALFAIVGHEQMDRDQTGDSNRQVRETILDQLGLSSVYSTLEPPGWPGRRESACRGRTSRFGDGLSLLTRRCARSSAMKAPWLSQMRGIAPSLLAMA
jgi:hypothetical protein